jgi:hypothetical protein
MEFAMKRKFFLLIFSIAFFPFFLFSQEEKIVNIAGRVSMFKAYKNCFYFLNESEGNIWRFDQNLNFLNKIGKRGEGPGEIASLSNFNFLEDKIYTISRDHILFFSLDGTLLNEVKIPPLEGSILLLKNGNFLEEVRDFSYERGKVIIQKIRFLDKNFKKIREVLDERLKITPGFVFEAIEPFIRADYSEKKGHVYVSNPSKDFLLMIFDENGNEIGKIFKEYKKIKVKEEYKEKFLETIIQDPHVTSKEMAEAIRRQTHFPEYFPPYQCFFLDDEGNIYIRTYERKGEKTKFEKYSSDGVFIRDYYLEDRRINIVDSHLFISFEGDNYYYLYEDEKGNYIMHRRKIRKL